MLSKYQYYGHDFHHGTHRLALVCTNSRREVLVVDMEEGPHDLFLVIFHTSLLGAYVDARVFLSFFGKIFLDCFWLGFLAGQ
jgi:hypothetical protein